MVHIIQPQPEKPTTVSVAEGNELIDKLLADRTANPQSSQPEATQTLETDLEFNVRESTEGFVISPISHNNSLYRVEINSELLDNGSEKNHVEWDNWCIHRDWKIPDAPLIDSIIYHMHKFRSSEQYGTNKWKENKKPYFALLSLLQSYFRYPGVTSITLILYKRNKPDTIIHVSGSKPSLQKSVISYTGAIDANTTNGLKNILDVLLHTENNTIQQIREYYQWISSGTTPQLQLNENTSNRSSDYQLFFGFTNQFHIETLPRTHHLQAFGVKIHELTPEELQQ